MQRIGKFSNPFQETDPQALLEMEAILEELARAQISPLNEGEKILKKRGPDPGYVLTFSDPDEKIDSIMGLNERNLELAFQVEEMGSIATFVEAEEQGDQSKINTLLENGFRASLAERALSGIHTTDAGDTDDQRLLMLLALISTSLEIKEPRPNNISVVISSFDLTRPTGYQRWMDDLYNTDQPRGSLLYVHLKPAYDREEVRSTLQEILPGLRFWINGNDLIIPIRELQEHIASFYQRPTRRSARLFLLR